MISECHSNIFIPISPSLLPPLRTSIDRSGDAYRISPANMDHSMHHSNMDMGHHGDMDMGGGKCQMNVSKKLQSGQHASHTGLNKRVLYVDDLHLVLQGSLYHLSPVAHHRSMDAFAVIAHGRAFDCRLRGCPSGYSAVRGVSCAAFTGFFYFFCYRW